MSDLLNRANLPITTGRTTPPAPPSIKGPATDETGTTFRELLRQSLPGTQTQELVFSKHAQARVARRGVEISPGDMERLERAIGLAREKGVTDSLVYMNDTAFIVNIPNKVVVTVVDGGDTRENVFTNINGAVIL